MLMPRHGLHTVSAGICGIPQIPPLVAGFTLLGSGTPKLKASRLPNTTISTLPMSSQEKHWSLNSYKINQRYI